MEKPVNFETLLSMWPNERHLLYPIVLPGDDVPGNVTFGPTWSNLLENAEALESTATLITPLSRKAFAVEDVQEPFVFS